MFYIYPQYKLTAQDVRDAAKLAPSAGAPAAGSLDLHLDDTLEDTGTTLPATLAIIDARRIRNPRTDTGTTLPADHAALTLLLNAILSDTGTDLPGALAALAAALAVVDGIADGILEDTGTTIPELIAAQANVGSHTLIYTLTSSTTGQPIADALVEVYTDPQMTNLHP